MGAAVTEYTCIHCGLTKPEIAMVRTNRKPGTVCLACSKDRPGYRHQLNRLRMEHPQRKHAIGICVHPHCQQPSGGKGYCDEHFGGRMNRSWGMEARCPKCNRYVNASGFCPLHDPRKAKSA